MTGNRAWCLAVAALLVPFASAIASAQGGAGGLGGLYQGHITGLVGTTAGGDAPNAILTLGGSMAVQDDTGWGSEIDFGYARNQSSQLKAADLASFMVNANWVKPRGPLHPYALFGVGALGVHGCLLPCSKITSTWNFGISGGAGARYDLNDVVSVSGDGRYFMAPGSHAGSSRPSNFGFWRVSMGLTFSWAFP